ncbi:MAG: 2-C-methyl-D-erythritol 2,4-cyclodiphosphate synthase [Tidjanibacter sp.]|nr:2-C-methyl-D-erythritol 2,4-cyclodiphosphate synthase [Tidjanibacter sp.]
MRIGFGYDVHALAEELDLVLCGVKVPSTFGCVAHSDGDVAIHALCDALLGAVALGDIGKHFPDNDMTYKGIDSTILLSRTIEFLKTEGYKVGNVDITIALERPKLRPHIDQMRARLAEVMGVEIGAVSVKATTTEKLGFTGRGEGVAAYAVALVVPAV